MIIVNEGRTALEISQPSALYRQLSSNRSDEGLTLETSASLFFTVANLRFQPSC